MVPDMATMVVTGNGVPGLTTISPLYGAYKELL